MDYKRLNTYVGWMVFIFATIVYYLTLEPTTSLWDCGEYITTAYKLEVGHPPGAPLFMMLGRLFTIFSSAEGAAFMVNFMSALCSSFSILFLFWTITMLGKRIVLQPSSIFSSNEVLDTDSKKNKATGQRAFTEGEKWAILGSGLIGAVAYTFTDSFWFSAVEGEVYAMSSFFTAIVIWAILKWDHEVSLQEAYPDDALINSRNANRWLVFIFFMTGLSIGVHLLNLLCIPAIAYVIYFRKYRETTTLGFIVTGIIGVATLGIVQAVLIPKTVQIAGFFERFFVNSLGAPFNSGTLIFFLIMIGIVVFVLYWSRSNGMAVLNTVTWALSMIFIGYSCFAMIVIRSNANTPLDENDPENLVSLESYLKREQYGDWPIMYGQYWMAKPQSGEKWGDRTDIYLRRFVVFSRTGKELKGFKTEKDAMAYAKTMGGTVDEKYYQTYEGEGGKPTFDPKYCTVFPRMYSPEPHHISGYKSWSGHKGDGKPSMSSNLRYFGSYQVDWMYWRYFMWNFSGRQWDEQGNGDSRNGNWISGLNFIDEHHIGDQTSDEEKYVVKDSAGNTMRMYKSEADADAYALANGGEVSQWDGIVTPSFIRENASHNKFYMLPLILGLIGFIFMLMKASKEWWIVMLLFLLTGFAIIIYLNQKPSEPRERDYAYAASFYAFSIFIGMAVLALYQAFKSIQWQELGITVGTMTVLSLIFSAADTTLALSMIYITVVVALSMGLMMGLRNILKNELHGAIVALLITLPVPILMGVAGWDDHDRSDRYTARDLAHNYLFSCEDQSILFTNGDNDTFPLWYYQEVEEQKTSVRVCNLSLLNTDWYTEQMTRQAYDSKPLPISFTEEQYRQNGLRDYLYVLSTNELTMGQAAIPEKWDTILSAKIKYNPNEFRAGFDAAADSLYSLLGKTGFPTVMPELYDSIPSLDSTKTYREFRNFILALLSNESATAYQFTEDMRVKIQDILLVFNDSFDYLPADYAMAYLADDANVEDRKGNKVFFLPARGLSVAVNKENCIKNKIIDEKDADRMVDEIRWRIPKQTLYKADIMVLDMVAHFNWERNIFFASSAEPSTYLGLDRYFYCEGLVYRLVPFPVTRSRNPNALGEINKDRMFENLMTTFKWGNMQKDGILVDYYTRRLTNNYRVQFSVLADAYLADYELHADLAGKLKETIANPEGMDTNRTYSTPVGPLKVSDMPGQVVESEAIMAHSKAQIIALLDQCLAVMPHKNVPFVDKVFPSLITAYYAVGEEEKGERLATQVLAIYEEEIEYYIYVEPEFGGTMVDDLFSAYRAMFSIYQGTSIYGKDKVFVDDVANRFYEITERIQPALEKIKKVSPSYRARVDATFGDFFNMIFGGMQ